MAKQIPLEKGQRFGSLTVVKELERVTGKPVQYLCQCDCGGSATPTKAALKSGNSKSCGCKGRFKPTSVIATGTRVHDIEVLNELPKEVKKPYMYLCRCTLCGKEVEFSKGQLLQETVRNCGCINNRLSTPHLQEGEQFGYLTVIEEAPRREKKPLEYLCRCQCGKVVPVTKYGLVAKNNLSCGCKNHRMVNVSLEYGQKFGRLMVLAERPHKPRAPITYLCQCDCGYMAVVNKAALVTGNTKSCGCMRKEYFDKIRKKPKLVENTGE